MCINCPIYENSRNEGMQQMFALFLEGKLVAVAKMIDDLADYAIDYMQEKNIDVAIDDNKVMRLDGDEKFEVGYIKQTSEIKYYRN